MHKKQSEAGSRSPELARVWLHAHYYDTPDILVSDYFELPGHRHDRGASAGRGLLWTVSGHQHMDLRERLAHLRKRDINGLMGSRAAGAGVDAGWRGEHAERTRPVSSSVASFDPWYKRADNITRNAIAAINRLLRFFFSEDSCYIGHQIYECSFSLRNLTTISVLEVKKLCSD
ncbi:hypothetical protein BKA67DRAFT_542480 [Truncatella angustata]|uniref:Uncharacterized protein n=1 Tax=Truncatella angustata TaxID=152316 RepID=A0A9P8UA66_9PEZI|nr:uncharacterized protein BKA67DRAFT_542480 [Truncatella angustata]KAH6639947.1 hypothetical protein BKA67DRAFT_542480 [Truncatella angustata]